VPDHGAHQGAVGRVRPPDSPAPREGLDPLVTAILADGPLGSACYRYRTAALVGPWRACPTEAQGDAVGARQAAFDEARGFVWTVPGRIETGCQPVEDEADPNAWSAH
jgi:hypothetical protein